jgi:type II secretion system protein N
MQSDSLDPSLLATGKKAKLPPGQAPAPAAISMPISRRRRILKRAAYVFLFLFSLIFFLLLKIPSGFITNIALQQINAVSPLQAEAQNIGLRFFLLPHLRVEKLELSPRFPDTGNPIVVDQLSLYPSFKALLMALSGKPGAAASFDMDAYKANISGSFAMSQATNLDLKVKDLDLAKFTPLIEAGFELQGVIQKLSLDLAMEAQKLSRADGEIHLSGKNFRLDPAAFQIPMVMPILDLGSVEIHGKLQKGKLRLEKLQVGDATKDMEVRVEGEIQLAEPLSFSRVDLKVKVKPADRIKKAMPTLEGMLGMVGAKKADGFYAMKVSGVATQPMLPTPDTN